MPEPLANDGFEYDVAISLLGEDVELAKRIADALVGLRVFLYTERQEDIAGRNAPEVFTETFERKSRLAVILHRQRWGSTPYTHAEERAIQARASLFRWGNYLVIKLDAAPLPTWIPGLIQNYFDFQEYGFEQAVGVIRRRAQEEGAVLRSESAADRAIRRARIHKEQADRDLLIKSREGSELILSELKTMFAAVCQDIDRVRREGDLPAIKCGADRERCVIRDRGVSTALFWYPRQWGEDGYLEIVTFRGPISIPGGKGLMFTRDAQRTSAEEFDARLTADGMRWVSRADGREYSTRGMVDLTIDRFVEQDGDD